MEHINQRRDKMKYDKIIIGAGIYGLYSALHCGKKAIGGGRILVLEKEQEAFTRATYVNQARVHMGYHYPRSFSTAIKSAGYFERFNQDPLIFLGPIKNNFKNFVRMRTLNVKK